MKRVTVILICLLMLLPILPLGAFADEPLTVVFNNDLPGSAAGVYTFKATAKGNYGFYWTDASGSKLTVTKGELTLPCTAIESFTANAGSTHTFKTNKYLAIPEGAVSLSVIDSAGKTAASFALPTSKLQTSSSSYSYGIISDLHYDGTYSNVADKTVPAALAFFKQVGANYSFGAGDIVTNAEEEYYQRFAKHVEESGITFLTCGGNHEVVGGAAKMFGEKEGEIGYFQTYVNAGAYDGTLEGVTDFAPNGYDFTFRIPGNDNDIFIFVSQRRWDDRSATMKPLIEPETLEWLGQMFEKYKDKNVHYFQHTLLADDDGTHIDGEGDVSNNVGYGYDYHYNTNLDTEKTLRSLMEQYKNVIWYNGHSHWTFEMEKYNENLNIFDYEGTTATMVHVPSVTAPRTIGDTSTSANTNAGKLSYGLLTDVHDNYEIVNGVDFMTNTVCANAVYIIYNDADVLVSGKLGEGIEWVFDRQLNSLRLIGSGAMPDFTGKTPDYAAYADKIVSLYVARSITTVGKNAFSCLTNLESAEIKDTVTVVGASAFEGCGKLGTVLLPDSVGSIGENAFRQSGIKTLAYSGTVESFGRLNVAAGNDELKSAAKTYGKYVITWKVGDYATVEELATGTVPVFTGAASMPIEAEDKYLPFLGWHNGTKLTTTAQSLAAVKANVTYTAVFGEEADRFITGTTASDKITWTLDRYNGMLIVDGKGILPEVESKEKQPWFKYADEIYTILVKGGITTVGKNNFCRLPVVNNIFFEKGVRDLKMDCFAYCDHMKAVYLPTSINNVANGASYQCLEIVDVLYGGSADRWPMFQKQISTTYNPILSGIAAEDVTCNATIPTDKTFTVTFVDEDGTVLKEVKNVKWGNGVIPPAAPTKEGKDFFGWDSPYFVVTDNLTVKAVFTGDEPQPTETPATETPATETPATETPATETPATETPATETPATETPASETPATENPTESKSEEPSKGLPIGAKIGIACGAAVVVIAVAAVVLVVKKKKH